MKRSAIVLAILLVSSAVPSFAGSIGVFGSYWDGNEAGTTAGAGVRLGFDFFKWLEFEFHGTYYTDFEEEIEGQDFVLAALPVDGGLRVNFIPESKFNVYLGGGATYYFLDTDLGEIDDEFTYYGEAGVEFGGDKTKFFIEALWRTLDTSVQDPSGDRDIDFGGISGNIGVNWRW